MTPVPNTFQCPNILIDQAMELLSDKEFRVLMFAVRHIMGWQDRIDDRQSCISISMFEHGYTSKTGRRFAGCGLGRGAIITAIASLVEFGFLDREGTATTKGQKYRLLTDGIKWADLENRDAQRATKNRKRTAAATEVRRGGTSNDTGTSDDTMQVTSDDTMQVTSDVLNQTHSSKPSSNTSRKHDPFYDAIAEVWKSSASGYIVSLKAMLRGEAKRGTWKDCNFDPPVTDAAEILAFEPYARNRMREKNITAMPTAAATIQRWFYDYRAAQKVAPIRPKVQPAQPVPEPVISVPPQSYEEIKREIAEARAAFLRGAP